MKLLTGALRATLLPLALLAICAGADAATLRLEYYQTGSQALIRPPGPLSSSSLAVTGSATSGGSRPTVPTATGPLVAVMQADTPVYVAIGAAPDPTAATKVLVSTTPVMISVSSGDLISAMTSSDFSSSGGGGAVTQSGTWTVQPGNTANTTAWLVTGTGGTFPATQSGTWNVTNISGTISLPTGAATAANQATANSSLSNIDSATSRLTSSASGVAHASPLATTALIAGCQYRSSVPTFADLEQAALRCNASGAVVVDGSGVTQPVSAVALPLPSGAATSAKQDTTNTSLSSIDGKLAAGHGTAAGAVRVELPTDGTGVVGLNAGSATIGNVGLVGQTSGGNSIYTLVAAATNNATSIKGSAGQVYGITVYNNSATIAYLKLYNKATAPTCGSDTPVEVHMIPASTSGAGAVVPSDIGVAYGTGIGICIVTGIANNDNTSVAASAYIVNVRYK